MGAQSNGSRTSRIKLLKRARESEYIASRKIWERGASLSKGARLDGQYEKQEQQARKRLEHVTKTRFKKEE